MSKKLEALKDAVFYAQQKPEVLATLLAGVITDTATSVHLSGASSITVPTGDTAVEETYTAEVLSQFGDTMSGTPTLALTETVTGVTVSGMKVSVAKTATATSFTLKATSGSLTAQMTVTLEHPAA